VEFDSEEGPELLLTVELSYIGGVHHKIEAVMNIRPWNIPNCPFLKLLYYYTTT